MSADIHYEVYLKKHRKGGWCLDQVLEHRGEALELAKERLASHPMGSVRVSKESYDEVQNRFLSVGIFEAGAERHTRTIRADNKMEPPCSSPDDLYALHARRTVARALAPWLQRNLVCVLELLHRSELAEKLAAAGHERQHAIQKIAIVQAGAQECSVQHIVRRLTELADKATDQLRKAKKNKLTARFHDKGFAVTLAAITGHKQPGFALRSALAERLARLKTWPDKISFLASCVSDALVECSEKEEGFEALDAYLSEIVSMPHALDACIEAEALGDKLDQFTDILSGKPPEHATGSARMLATAISSGKLMQTRSTLASRIFSELRGPRRLYPDRFEDEITLNRSLADRLIRLPPALVLPEQLNEAFIIRSSRLLEADSIERLLSLAKHPGAEILMLVDFEKSIVGEQNKCKLAAFLRAVIGAHKTNRWFCKGGASTFQRLAVCARAQKWVLAGGFCDKDKQEISIALDRLCLDAMTCTGALEQIEGQSDPSLQKAIRLLKLAGQGLITMGDCTAKASQRAMILLRSREARAAMLEDTSGKREELAALLQQAKTQAAKTQAA